MFILQAETTGWLETFNLNLQMTHVDQDVTNQLRLPLKTLLPTILISVPSGQFCSHAFLNNFHSGPLQKLHSALSVTSSLNKCISSVFQNNS